MIRIRKHTLWWYLWDFNRRWSPCPPNEYDTNLCQFMRCTLVWLPLKFLIPALLLSAGIVWWERSLDILTGFAVLAVLVGLGVGIAYLADKADQRDFKRRVSDNLIWQYAKAKKRKICPLVEVD